MGDFDVREKIERRRRQLWVHSVIYYKFDNNIIDDETWTRWARELKELQDTYPDISKKAYLYEEFKDFDPSTGFNLPMDNPYVVLKAAELLDYAGKGPLE